MSKQTRGAAVGCLTEVIENRRRLRGGRHVARALAGAKRMFEQDLQSKINQQGEIWKTKPREVDDDDDDDTDTKISLCNLQPMFCN